MFFLAGESTPLAVVRLSDSRTRECSFNAKVRMTIIHVQKRAQSLPFMGSVCLSISVLSSLLLLEVRNILQKICAVGRKRGRKGHKESRR